jgi:hypothetical protein
MNIHQPLALQIDGNRDRTNALLSASQSYLDTRYSPMLSTMHSQLSTEDPMARVSSV